MADQPVAGEPPAAPKVYERKTRAPDWLTDVVLGVTAIFGIWAVGLVGLTFVGILQPAFYYNDTKAAIKAAGSTVVVLLTFSQFYTMESVLGHVPRGRIKMRSMMRVHRWGGRIAILLAAVIASSAWSMSAPRTSRCASWSTSWPARLRSRCSRSSSR